MPAVIPADVARLASLMKIGSGSTVMSGYCARLAVVIAYPPFLP